MVADAVQRLMKDDSSRGPSTAPAYTAEDVDRMIGEALKGQVRGATVETGKKNRYYAVAKGFNADSVGVYPSHAAAAPHYLGASGAVQQKFNTEAEAWAFIRDFQASQEAEAPAPPPSGDTPVATQRPGQGEGPSPDHLGDEDGPVPPRGGTVAGAGGGRTQGTTQVCAKCQPVGRHHPAKSYDVMGQAPIGPDPSTGKKKSLFGVTLSTDTILREEIAPAGLSSVVKEQLCEQMLDGTALPGTCITSNDDSQLSSLARAMNKLVDSQSTPLGGQTDTQFKSAKRNTLATIKNAEDLQARIVELTECEEMVMENTLGNLVSVLRCGGVAEPLANHVARNCLILRISGDILKNFLRLHTHIKHISDTRGWQCAVVIKEYYSKKLLEIRNTYSTRLSVLCHHYIFLRDSADKGFQSLRLQDTQLAVLLRNIESKGGSSGSAGGNTGGSDGQAGGGGQSGNGCRYCGTQIHTGGKPECPWGHLSSKAAKAAAREALRELAKGGGNKGCGGEDGKAGGAGGKDKDKGEEAKKGGK